MLPDEALQYCDAVVVGEVEGIWSKVLGDFEANRMAGVYRGPHVDLEHFDILPRRDLLHPDYLWQTIQTSRGCPFECDFCSVSRYLGRRYRQRTAESVLKELSTMQGKYVMFLDDNLVGYSKQNNSRALAIFEGMIAEGIKKTWWMQASINVADDDLLLKRAAESGCTYVLIGFETIETDGLKNMRKGINLKTGVENYDEVVRRLHRHNIGVMGAFIIGNDYETPEYYKKLADFIVRAGIDIAQISILTPLPGTALMDKIVAEDRLLYKSFPADWEKFRLSCLTHQPEGTDTARVYAGTNYIKRHIYSFPVYYYRLIKSLLSLRRPISIYIVYKMNQAIRRGWKNSHYHYKYSDMVSNKSNKSAS